MLIDGVPVESGPQTSNSFIGAFLSFIERRLNVRIVRDVRTIPYGRSELSDVFAIARTLQNSGVIESLRQIDILPDEPPFKRWAALCRNTARHSVGGASSESDRQALLATLAEGLERFLWNETTDSFVSPVRASVAEIAAYGAFVDPARFAGITGEDRARDPFLTLHAHSRYLWIKAHSLVTDASVYVPAQTVSGVRDLRTYDGATEPLIRLPITTGVATWPGILKARLAGTLEVIERDAYMITWLNQITPSRIPLDSFRTRETSLSRLLARCERYRLRVHALRLITDAPTHAVAVVLEDESGVAPRFAVGLKANQSLAHAIEGAAIEALRARSGYRAYDVGGGTWDTETPTDTIGHVERLHYYGHPENAQKLAFLTRGGFEQPVPVVWEGESDASHLSRLVTWCTDNGYELASVSLGASKQNPLPWDVVAIVIPELQPTHLTEQLRQVGGGRLRSVPEKLGYTARATPFIEAPHPFA